MFFLAVLFKTNHTDIDIKKYSKVQTGPKTQLGGLKAGRFNSEYHGSLKEDVAKPPIAEAENVIKSIKIRDKYLFFSIK